MSKDNLLIVWTNGDVEAIEELGIQIVHTGELLKVTSGRL